MKIRLQFEPRDLWVGVYWNKHLFGWTDITVHVYVCILPCLPIHIWWHRRLKETKS